LAWNRITNLHFKRTGKPSALQQTRPHAPRAVWPPRRPNSVPLPCSPQTYSTRVPLQNEAARAPSGGEGQRSSPVLGPETSSPLASRGRRASPRSKPPCNAPHSAGKGLPSLLGKRRRTKLLEFVHRLRTIVKYGEGVRGVRGCRVSAYRRVDAKRRKEFSLAGSDVRWRWWLIFARSGWTKLGTSPPG